MWTQRGQTGIRTQTSALPAGRALHTAFTFISSPFALFLLSFSSPYQGARKMLKQTNVSIRKGYLERYYTVLSHILYYFLIFPLSFLFFFSFFSYSFAIFPNVSHSFLFLLHSLVPLSRSFPSHPIPLIPHPTAQSSPMSGKRSCRGALPSLLIGRASLRAER